MSTKETEYVRMTIKIPKDLMRDIRVIAAQQDKRIYETLSDLLRRAVNVQKTLDDAN